MSEKEVRTVMNSVDLDHNGTVDWEEFLTMVREMERSKPIPLKGVSAVYSSGVRQPPPPPPPPHSDDRKFYSVSRCCSNT